MSDRAARTEKATPQRLRKAKKEGQVARSAEVPVAVSLLATVAALAVFGRPIIDQGLLGLRAALTGMGSPDAFASVGRDAFRLAIVMGGPIIAVATFGAVIAGVAQVGIRLTPELAKPKLNRLDPRKGLEKFKPSVAGWELIRSTAKLAAVAIVVWPTLAAWRDHLGTDRTLAGGIDRLSTAYGGILLRAALLALVIAGADLLYQRRRVAKQLRMTKDEVRREHKDAEGDPLLRSARRRRASELSRNRMLSDAAGADVLLVNPTHLAVALRYDPDDGAPRVVAKGADRVADTLRAIAHRGGIPVVADKPLARTLFRQCKVGHHVPAALYEAVAVVLAVAYRRSGRAPGSRPPADRTPTRRRTRRRPRTLGGVA